MTWSISIDSKQSMMFQKERASNHRKGRRGLNSTILASGKTELAKQVARYLHKDLKKVSNSWSRSTSIWMKFIRQGKPMQTK